MAATAVAELPGGRSAWAALRLLADVAISFSRNPFAAIGANDDDDD